MGPTVPAGLAGARLPFQLDGFVGSPLACDFERTPRISKHYFA